MNKAQGVEMVGTDLHIEETKSGVGINMDGEYPIQINNHFIMSFVKDGDREFRCVNCEDSIELSDVIWKIMNNVKREKTTEYAIGYFIESNCDSPGAYKGVFEESIDMFVGEPLTKRKEREIIKSLKESMSSYE